MERQARHGLQYHSAAYRGIQGSEFEVLIVPNILAVIRFNVTWMIMAPKFKRAVIRSSGQGWGGMISLV